MIELQEWEWNEKQINCLSAIRTKLKSLEINYLDVNIIYDIFGDHGPRRHICLIFNWGGIGSVGEEKALEFAKALEVSSEIFHQFYSDSELSEEIKIIEEWKKI